MKGKRNMLLSSFIMILVFSAIFITINVASTEEGTDELTPEDYKRLYDWGLQKQLTWSVFVFASLTGLIEIMSLMKWYRKNRWFSRLLILVYVVLAFSLSYSFYMVGKFYEILHEWSKKMPLLTEEIGRAGRGLPHTWLLVDENNNIRIGIFAAISVISFIIWMCILALKMYKKRVDNGIQ